LAVTQTRLSDERAMTFRAFCDGRFQLGDRWTRCALGRGGVIAAADKREGDGATPLGVWPMRRVLYRPNRGAPPATALPTTAISPDDGWCDDVGDAAYNRPVSLPYPGRCERMWREDGLYDLVVVLAHNDDPPIPGLGSAIFLHCASPEFKPTEGCVALAREDLEAVLALALQGDAIEVRRA
jgi:L,D-peptidoglycan transpeptidase YkuD (ErfK/YbiS/YcfS/YnhG family)